MMKLFLIRHQKPEHYKPGIFVGRSNPALSESGVRNAVAMGKQFTGMEGIAIYSSPQKRARQTAENAFPNEHIEFLTAACEQDFGILEGLSSKEVELLYPEFYKSTLINAFNYKIVDGENWEDMTTRAKLVIDLIVKPNHTAILVGHQFLFYAIIWVMTGKIAKKSLDFGESYCLEKTKNSKVWKFQE